MVAVLVGYRKALFGTGFFGTVGSFHLGEVSTCWRAPSIKSLQMSVCGQG